MYRISAYTNMRVGICAGNFFLSIPADLQGQYSSILNQLPCKKRITISPSPAGMSLTKLSLAGNN